MSIFSLNRLFDMLLWVETVFSVVLHGGKGGRSMSYSKETFLMFNGLLPSLPCENTTKGERMRCSCPARSE